MQDSSNHPNREDETFAKALLGSDVPPVDVRAAYDATVLRAAQPGMPWPAIGVAAAAAALVCGLAFTPLGGMTAQLLTIFEPHSFAPIQFTAQDAEQLRLAPGLKQLGSAHFGHTRATDVSTLAGAEAGTGLSARTLAYAPEGKPQRPHFLVLSRATTTFTFSAAKARAYAARTNHQLPPMPPGLDGTTVGVTTGPGIVTAFGDIPKGRHDYERLKRTAGMLVFLQMRAPHVSSTGASLATLEQYLLAMPNVPANVAMQLRAIADPTQTLPIPVRIDRNAATHVTIDGVEGLAIGDETGLGSGIVWQKDGMLYALSGSVPMHDLIAIAHAVK